MEARSQVIARRETQQAVTSGPTAALIESALGTPSARSADSQSGGDVRRRSSVTEMAVATPLSPAEIEAARKAAATETPESATPPADKPSNQSTSAPTSQPESNVVRREPEAASVSAPAPASIEAIESTPTPIETRVAPPIVQRRPGRKARTEPPAARAPSPAPASPLAETSASTDYASDAAGDEPPDASPVIRRVVAPTPPPPPAASGRPEARRVTAVDAPPRNQPEPITLTPNMPAETGNGTPATERQTEDAVTENSNDLAPVIASPELASPPATARTLAESPATPTARSTPSAAQREPAEQTSAANQPVAPAAPQQAPNSEPEAEPVVQRRSASADAPAAPLLQPLSAISDTPPEPVVQSRAATENEPSNPVIQSRSETAETRSVIADAPPPQEVQSLSAAADASRRSGRRGRSAGSIRVASGSPSGSADICRNHGTFTARSCFPGANRRRNSCSRRRFNSDFGERLADI